MYIGHQIDYKIQLNPFRITQYVNGKNAIEMNSNDLMLFKRDGDSPIVASSFTFHGSHLFGIPERPDKLLLECTTDQEPYRLYNLDVFKHYPDTHKNLYGSIPYLQIHTPDFDAAVAWMNAADTYVDIRCYDQSDEQKIVTILSESGVLEFFFVGAKNPGQQSEKLSKLTGFPVLHPLFALGYHYSQWTNISTQVLTDWHNGMEQHQIPFDTLWMDIGYTDNNRYFIFDQERFKNLDLLVNQMERDKRRMVVITDPHIAMDNYYEVYKEGKGDD